MHTLMPRTSVQEERRFADIETLLLWEGEAGNTRLRDLYGIGIGAASVVLKAYRSAYPGHCQWSSSRRVYEAPVTGLRPTLTAGNLDEYVALLGRTASTASSATTHSESIERSAAVGPQGEQGTVTRVRIDLTEASPGLYRLLHRAARDQSAVSLRYASMTNPEPATRIVIPQVLVQVGRRWHLRAYDQKTSSFRDFALGRILDASESTADLPAELPVDTAWRTKALVEIVPHPLLTPAQTKVICHELMAGKASRAIACRAALVHYVIQELRASLNPKKQIPPDYQIAVTNAADLKPWLFPS